MITEKLQIYGDKENVQGVQELLAKCIDMLDVEVTQTLVYTDKPDKTVNCDDGISQVVVDYEDKDAVCSDNGVTTYSFSDSRSSVTALNEQKKENFTCFELLSGVSMSRIFIADAHTYTAKQVLVCTAVLCALGVTAEKTVETINGLLK